MPRPIQDLEAYIHKETLNDLVAAYLYTTTFLADDEEVLDLSLSDPNKEGVRTINVKVIKNKEVELIVHS